jgi:hypothetical protein
LPHPSATLTTAPSTFAIGEGFISALAVVARPKTNDTLKQIILDCMLASLILWPAGWGVVVSRPRLANARVKRRFQGTRWAGRDCRDPHRALVFVLAV